MMRGRPSIRFAGRVADPKRSGGRRFPSPARFRSRKGIEGTAKQHSKKFRKGFLSGGAALCEVGLYNLI